VNHFYSVAGEGFNSQSWLSDSQIDIKEGCILERKLHETKWCNNGASYNIVGGVDYIEL